MRLANFKKDGALQAGIVTSEEVIPLANVAPDLPTTVEGLIVAGDDAKTRLRAIELSDAPRLDLFSVELASPILRPGKFLALGMNYRRHVEEAIQLGITPAKYQYWFNKQITCINGPYGHIVKPDVSDTLDHEVELAFVIGRRAKNVKAAQALSYIAGYTICNDVSVREWQNHTPTFTMGKSFDSHGPLGPWLVMAEEIQDPQSLGLRCLVNGEVRQHSNTSDMVYSCADMIQYLSTAFTLEPGDVIATGTPEGVGVAKNPPVFLKVGDVVRCEIDGIGFIENEVIAET